MPSRKRHDARRGAGDDRLRLREEAIRETFGGNRLREIDVEFLRNVARKLKMLLLVVAHRHMRRAIGQDVRRHQHGIDVEPDARVFAVLARLLLELRHAVQPADARHAVQNPGEFRMRVDLRLVENDVLLRVHARRDERRRDLARGAAQIGRVLPDRDRVHVDDAIDAIVMILQRHEFRDRAEIVAEMQIAGRLDAGENALFHGFGSPE